NLRAYRGQGYWIPEINDDVDTESIESLLPQMEKKLAWIREQKSHVQKHGIPNVKVLRDTEFLLNRLLSLKKTELESDERKKIKSRKESLALMGKLVKSYEVLIKKVAFLS